MRISAAIMAHPARERFAVELAAELGDVPIAMDPKPRRPREESVWPVRRAALELADPSADFHLVVQDDAVVGRDFWPRLHALVRGAGEVAFSLYYRHVPAPRVQGQVPSRGYYGPARASYGPEPAEAEAALEAGGFSWPHLMFGVAIVVPTPLVVDMVRACDHMTRVRADDVRLQYFLLCRGVPVFYPLPSLVDHRRDIRGRNGGNAHRGATWFE